MTRRRAAPDAPEGGLVVDKAGGLTSHDVVALARRVLGQPRVGHTGTLDPLATGVLPLLLGRATRLSQFLVGDEKEYEAVVRFGQATTTYDSEGEPAGPPSPERPDATTLEHALDRFRGAFEQVPPSVSAKRVGGRRAYELARADRPVELAPVPVHVRHLELVTTDGETASLKVACSSGFYVRSLAHDLGQALGMGAHLTALRRTRSGRFGLPGSLTVEALASAPVDARERVIPLADLLPDVPAVTLQPEGRERTLHGRDVLVEHLADGALPAAGVVRLLDRPGTLLAVAEWRAGALHPVVVLM